MFLHITRKYLNPSQNIQDVFMFWHSFSVHHKWKGARLWSPEVNINLWAAEQLRILENEEVSGKSQNWA